MKGYSFLTVGLTVLVITLSHTYLFSQSTTQIDIYNYRTISHTSEGTLTIEGVHGLDYSYRVARDPMGILLTDDCLMLCGNYFETSLSTGTSYVTVTNRNARRVCEATIEIPASFASSTKLVDNTTAPITSDFSVFPNPSTDQLTIQFNAPIAPISQLYLINTLGQVLQTIPRTTSSTYQIDVSNYPSGIYELVAMNQENASMPSTRKIVIIQ